MPERSKPKPRISIVPTGAPNRPFLFCVIWRGNHWKNSQWFTFDEALVAAGVKSVHELPSASDLFQGFAVGGVASNKPFLVGEQCEPFPYRKSDEA